MPTTVIISPDHMERINKALAAAVAQLSEALARVAKELLQAASVPRLSEEEVRDIQGKLREIRELDMFGSPYLEPCFDASIFKQLDDALYDGPENIFPQWRDRAPVKTLRGFALSYLTRCRRRLPRPPP